MRSITPKSSLVLALTGVIAVCGVNEARTMPFHLHRAASDASRTAPHGAVSHGASAHRSAGMSGGIAFGELMNGRGEDSDAASLARLVRLRPSTYGVTAEKLLADVGALDATPGGRPIGDVYDLAGAATGVSAPIMPHQVATRARTPEVHVGTRTVEAPHAHKLHEPRQWSPPEPPAPPESARPVPTSDALDLSLKTLDYLVMATRILVETISRIIVSDQ